MASVPDDGKVSKAFELCCQETHRVKTVLKHNQDEDGQFRSLDGIKRSERVSLKTSPTSLEELRTFLTDNHSTQRTEIESSGLLHESEHPYADTESTNTLLRAHRHLIRLREMDTVLLNAQRQGRFAFYMTCTGEEAIHMGAVQC